MRGAPKTTHLSAPCRRDSRQRRNFRITNVICRASRPVSEILPPNFQTPPDGARALGNCLPARRERRFYSLLRLPVEMPSPPNFLIVDDNPDSRFLLVKTLLRKF